MKSSSKQYLKNTDFSIVGKKFGELTVIKYAYTLKEKGIG